MHAVLCNKDEYVQNICFHYLIFHNYALLSGHWGEGGVEKSKKMGHVVWVCSPISMLPML